MRFSGTARPRSNFAAERLSTSATGCTSWPRIDSRADALGEYATLLGDPHLINTRLADVNTVEVDAIAAAAAAWFGRDRRGTLIYRKDQP